MKRKKTKKVVIPSIYDLSDPKHPARQILKMDDKASPYDLSASRINIKK